MKIISILTTLALLVSPGLYSETSSEAHLEAFKNLLPCGFSLKQEKIEVSESATHSEVKLVNPTVYFFGSVPVASQEGDLIIREEGKQLILSTTGTTHLSFGEQFDIASSITAKIEIGDGAPMAKAFLGDFAQTWKLLEVQLGKGKILYLDKEQKSLIAEIDSFLGKLTYLGETEKKSQYKFESKGENITLPGLISENYKALPSLFQLMKEIPVFNTPVGSFFTFEPEDHGTINFSFSGSLAIPEKCDLMKIAQTANRDPWEAFKIVAAQNLSFNLTSWEYSDRFSSSKGALSINTSIADQLSRISMEGRMSDNVSQASTSRIKNGLLETRAKFLPKEFFDAISEKDVTDLVPHFHEMGTLTSAFGITLDVKDNCIEKSTFHASFSSENPEIGVNMSGVLEGLANPGPYRGKITLKLANYEEIINRGVAFYNRLAYLYGKIDQSGKWVPLTPEHVQIGKESLRYFAETPTNNGMDIQIEADFTDPNNLKLGKIPVGKIPLLQSESGN